MNVIKIWAFGIAIVAVLGTALAPFTACRNAAAAPWPTWPLVDSNREQCTFTQEQLQKGSAMMWQIYSQGYKDGLAGAPAPGIPSGANTEERTAAKAKSLAELRKKR